LLKITINIYLNNNKSILDYRLGPKYDIQNTKIVERVDEKIKELQHFYGGVYKIGNIIYPINNKKYVQEDKLGIDSIFYCHNFYVYNINEYKPINIMEKENKCEISDSLGGNYYEKGNKGYFYLEKNGLIKSMSVYPGAVEVFVDGKIESETRIDLPYGSVKFNAANYDIGEEQKIWLVGEGKILIYDKFGKAFRNSNDKEGEPPVGNLLFKADAKDDDPPPLGNLRYVDVNDDGSEARIVGDGGVFYRTQARAAKVIKIETGTNVDLHGIVYDAERDAGIIMGDGVLLYFQEAPGLPKLTALEQLKCKDFAKPKRRWQEWGSETVAAAAKVHQVCLNQAKLR